MHNFSSGLAQGHTQGRACLQRPSYLPWKAVSGPSLPGAGIRPSLLFLGREREDSLFVSGTVYVRRVQL